MLFCISVESPAKSSFKASGRWTVDAEGGEHAIINLLMAYPLTMWLRGSDWNLSPLCPDCPYRETTHDEEWIGQAIHCCGRRRAPLASGVFDA